MIEQTVADLFVRLQLIVAVAGTLSGCCSGPMCRDVRSGPDRERTRATPIKLNTVADDHVSARDKDATDWKSVMVHKPGKLTVELHWDDENSRLTVGLFDTIGKQLAVGRDWGQKGQRIELARAAPGRYFVRIHAPGADDASAYSLRVRYERDTRRPTGACHDCTVGERICLKSDGYAVCEKSPAGCNAWSRTFSCPKGQSCKKGQCVAGCVSQCTSEQRRCSAADSYQLCRQTDDGCLQWSPVTPCPRGRRCVAGRCHKVRPGKHPVKPTKPDKPDKPVASTQGNGKIISIYRYRGRMTLHIEIGSDSGIRAGNTGTVLRGNSGRPLAGGEIQVTKVSGRFCIATTTLSKLGKNRWVRIKVE